MRKKSNDKEYVKPIEGVPGMFLLTVIRRNPEKFAVNLMVGDFKRASGYALARIDMEHGFLHVDIEHDRHQEKFEFKEDIPEVSKLPSFAESYFRKNWKVFLHYHIHRQEDFTPPQTTFRP